MTYLYKLQQWLEPYLKYEVALWICGIAIGLFIGVWLLDKALGLPAQRRKRAVFKKDWDNFQW